MQGETALVNEVAYKEMLSSKPKGQYQIIDMEVLERNGQPGKEGQNRKLLIWWDSDGNNRLMMTVRVGRKQLRF